jgi:hypothetical protein
MSDTFQILSGFLDRFGAEVEGRILQEPPDEVKSRLEQFARGSLPVEEQTGVFEMLNRNPQWVAWLASEVKSLRPGTREQ